MRSIKRIIYYEQVTNEYPSALTEYLRRLKTAANDEVHLPITTSPSFIEFNDENVYCSNH